MKENQKESLPPEAETTRRVLMEVVLVNNRTDKEYTIQSKTDLGLTLEWQFPVLSVSQLIKGGHESLAVGRFTDFSIVSTYWAKVNN